MAISQTRLDAMIVEQRRMFGSENLIINGYCEGTGVGETVDAHRFTPTHIPTRRMLPNSDGRNGRGVGRRFNGQRDADSFLQHTCVFFCEHCNTATTIHRYGRPFIDPMGRLVRRCMNDGTSRRHTNNDRERCTDKHVLLKKYQVHRGIPAHLRSQMENPDAQIARELERQERRETTNERPSDFGPAPRSTSARPMTDFTERLRRDGLVTTEGG